MKAILQAIIVFMIAYSGENICRAGNDNNPAGARSAGMASASVTQTDIWSSTNNQAGLGYLEHPVAGFYYENRFHVKGLSIQGGAIAVPVKSTTVGFAYRYFGYATYNESKFALNVGKKLGEKFALGVQMDYFRTHFAGEYGNFGALCAEVGMLCEPVEDLTIGLHVFNPTQTRQSANPEERIPAIMRLGVAYNIRGKAIICAETEKDMRMKAVFKGALEFNPLKNLYLRCGVSSGFINQYAFGIGYGWDHLAVDIAFSHHKFLGYSPHISITANL